VIQVRHRKVIITAALIILALVAVGCGGGATDEQVASTTVTETTTATTVAVPSPSPSPSPTPTQESVVQEFAEAVADRGGYPVQYAVLEKRDFKSGGEVAPIVLMVWGNTPNGFNEFRLIQNVLVDEGYDLLLASYGIESYGDGTILKSQDSVFVFAVRLKDAKYVPGPNGSDHTDFALPKTIPDFEVARTG
jgi:ABC-type glycerol-3-phosphate transport system substrate-binding protein